MALALALALALARFAFDYLNNFYDQRATAISQNQMVADTWRYRGDIGATLTLTR